MIRIKNAFNLALRIFAFLFVFNIFMKRMLQIQYLGMAHLSVNVRQDQVSRRQVQGGLDAGFTYYVGWWVHEVNGLQAAPRLTAPYLQLLVLVGSSHSKPPELHTATWPTD